jgi:XTP/dITP diphosphohydrolase
MFCRRVNKSGLGMITLYIATRNSHKVGEIRSILGSQFACHPLTDFPAAPVVTEDARTFAGNATKKAVSLANWLANSGTASSGFVVADDSGLEVDALNGAPGVHSARFAHSAPTESGNAADCDNNAKLLRLLQNVPAAKRTARFRCVIALVPILLHSHEITSPVCYADEIELQTETFEGTCEGRILDEPRGNAGFGYDPLFLPDGQDATLAELGEQIKNRISHRAVALSKLKARFSVEASPDPR